MFRGRILIVEDEPGLVLTLTDRLEAEGYTVSSSTDGAAGFERALTEEFDLILLDSMLPRKPGPDVCRDLRQHGRTTPILMLTARGEVQDRVIGLKLGADDYLVKPFEMAELLARIEARMRQHGALAAPPSRVVFGDVEVDFRRPHVIKGQSPIELSSKELQLLRYLVDRAGSVVSRQELLRAVWGYAQTPFTRTVDVHVANLRRKLEGDPAHPRFLKTVHGLGYRFDGD